VFSRFSARLGSRFCLPHIYERELRRSLNGCAFVIMQIENQQYDNQHGQGFDIHAIGLDSQKRLGEIAEASFLAKASSLGFGVSKPWIEERYDFVLDSGYRFWRVQVKSTRTTVPPGYLVRFMGKNQAPYTDKEIDFAVAYLVPEDAWYVIPVKLLKGQNTMIFYPQRKGNRNGRSIARDGARWLVLTMNTDRAKL
jgi:hypothetical protein